MNIRNTFHWGRRQYAALSTTNVASFAWSDFRLARWRHWLRYGCSLDVSETLSVEREPSPDTAGNLPGRKTWYGYYGQQSGCTDGTGFQLLPMFEAMELGDGSSRFIYSERNNLGYATNQVSTYSVGATLLLRTNMYTYAANEIELLRATNALGVQVSSNAYNAYHQVLTNFNALGEQTVFTYDASKRLSSVTLPTGLITTNLYGADGFLAQQIVTGIATNSFTYSNDLVFTHTDARGWRATSTWDALQRLRRGGQPDGAFITNTIDKLDLVRVVDGM